MTLYSRPPFLRDGHEDQLSWGCFPFHLPRPLAFRTGGRFRGHIGGEGNRFTGLFFSAHTCVRLWNARIQVKMNFVRNNCLGFRRVRRRVHIPFVGLTEFSSCSNSGNGYRCSTTHDADVRDWRIEFRGFGHLIPTRRKGRATVVQDIIGRRQSSACPRSLVRPKLRAQLF